MVYKYREILSNRNAISSLCETSCEAQFRPDVTSFFVGWCIYENFRSLLPHPWFLLFFINKGQIRTNRTAKLWKVQEIKNTLTISGNSSSVFKYQIFSWPLSP